MTNEELKAALVSGCPVESGGIVNSFLKMIGLNPVNMMYTNFSVVMGLVCDLVPFMVIPIHTSLAKMDYSLIEAASDLGASRFKVFTKVTLKLSLPGVISGVTMVFLLSDRKSTRLNSSHDRQSRMPSSA